MLMVLLSMWRCTWKRGHIAYPVLAWASSQDDVRHLISPLEAGESAIRPVANPVTIGAGVATFAQLLDTLGDRELVWKGARLTTVAATSLRVRGHTGDPWPGPGQRA
jgi:hypothetical protein